MLRFAANLTMMYNEHAFLDRFAAASRDGFKGVEFLFPYDYPAQEIAAQLAACGLELVLFNAPAGNWASGERGLACLADREEEFRASVLRALEYAVALDCPRIHVMAGIQAPGTPHDQARSTYVRNIAWAAERAAVVSRTILMEPINPVDMPGYFLNRQQEAHSVAMEIGAPNLKVQMDLYHCAHVEGDVAAELRTWLVQNQPSHIGHMQIAGFPSRHEPDSGTLDYSPIFDLIEQAGYEGWIGCEYRPAGLTSDGLSWLHHRKSRAASAK